MNILRLAAALCLLVALPAKAGRLALVIGESGYAALPPLPACSASAGLVARRLTAAGYAVTSLSDLTNGALGGAIAAFGDRTAADPASPALIYVCGYGASLDQRDFLLPVSAQIARPTDLLSEGVLTRAFLAAARPGRTAPLLLVLDLVRDPEGALMPASGALAHAGMPPGIGVLVVSETKPPSAPTALSAAVASAFSSGTLGPAPLAGIAASLPASGGLSLAGVQDVTTPKLAAPSPPPPVPPAPAPSPSPSAKPMPDEAAMSEADRRQVQIALASLGYYDGRLDGIFGPDTRAAIRRWQHEMHAEMTGRLTAAQATQLEAARH